MSLLKNKERDEIMKKKKLNLIAIGNVIGMIASASVILESLYHAIFKMQTLTYFGMGVMIAAFIVFGANFNYFEERLGK